MVGTSPLKKKSLQLGEALGGSVQETLAGLLPAAGRAPHVAILHAVHLPALLALSPGLPVRQARKRRSVRVILWAFFADLKIPGKL